LNTKNRLAINGSQKATRDWKRNIGQKWSIQRIQSPRSDTARNWLAIIYCEKSDQQVGNGTTIDQKWMIVNVLTRSKAQTG